MVPRICHKYSENTIRFWILKQHTRAQSFPNSPPPGFGIHWPTYIGLQKEFIFQHMANKYF